MRRVCIRKWPRFEALLVLRLRSWLAKGCDGGLEAGFQLKS